MTLRVGLAGFRTHRSFGHHPGNGKARNRVTLGIENLHHQRLRQRGARRRALIVARHLHHSAGSAGYSRMEPGGEEVAGDDSRDEGEAAVETARKSAAWTPAAGEGRRTGAAVLTRAPL